MKNYLAIDIGASSGRHIVESNGMLTEVYRFETGFVRQGETLTCDIEKLTANVVEGIKRAFSQFVEIESLAIDTWGVDYVLMNGDKEILPCVSYRDERTNLSSKQVHEIISFNELYTKTGIQFCAFNTVYQLYADKLSGKLDNATDFLMLPEYLNFKLTGNKVKEYTNATTTGMVNAETNKFDAEIIERLGLPKQLFNELSQCGTVVGDLLPDIQKQVKGNCKVKLCASHDTGSAYEAVECGERSVIISSGTWSLIGTKIKTASTSKESLQSNFSNEGGVGYFRYLKNIMGMWLVNQVQKQCGLAITEIVEQAQNSGYNYIFDVNDSSLMMPDNMEEAIKSLLKKQDCPIPQNYGDLFSSIYHSLARSYDIAIKQMEHNLGTKFEDIYIVGGGAKNNYLNALTEQYTGKKVVALPIEATAIGNLKVQKN